MTWARITVLSIDLSESLQKISNASASSWAHPGPVAVFSHSGSPGVGTLASIGTSVTVRVFRRENGFG
ncbi:hypothetical protein BWQ92_13725 [Arthrobacter sp. QXT-31]|nr:hypothetical protein BWQ92_13725 [Arthrobacter sp. QXT-31]